MAISPNLLEYISGSILIEINEVVNSDYHSYIIDIDFNQYFNQKSNIIDIVQFEMLNLSRKTHKDQFCEVINKIIEIMHFEDTFKNGCNKHIMKS